MSKAELQLLNRTEQDLEWFNENHEEIVKEYDEMFVAIKDQKIIVAEKSMEKVINKLNELKESPFVTWIGFVSKIKTVL